MVGIVKAVFGRTVGLLPKPANEPEKRNGEKAVDATWSNEVRASNVRAESGGDVIRRRFTPSWRTTTMPDTHESLANLTPADVDFGNSETILLEREDQTQDNR